MNSSEQEFQYQCVWFQISGLLYHNHVLWVDQWLQVPSVVASVTHKLVGGVFATAPPPNLNQPMGATLEIQRAQHIEQLEQQMAWAQLQQRPQVGVSCNSDIWRSKPEKMDVGQTKLKEEKCPYLKVSA